MYNSNLKRKFINYVVPSVVAMWVFSLYTMVDGIFVGRGVGSAALAAVNISMPFVNFIFAVSILFSVGASTVISMYLGEGKKEKANKTFSLIICTLVFLSAIILILSYFNLNKIAVFLGANATTIGYVTSYLKVIMFFNGFFMVAYCLEVLCKTDGFPSLSITAVIIAALTNVLLDYIFVIKLGMGVSGAALATGLSQVMSSLIFMAHFLSKRSNLKFAKLEIDFKEIKRIVSIGFPDSLTELATAVVIIIFNQSILKYIGENGVVAYSVITYVSTLVIMTIIGINQGMQPLSSFHYGKNEYDSVKKLLKMSLIAIAGVSIFAFLGSFIFANSIVGIFISPSDSAVFSFAVNAFRVYSISFLLVGFNILIAGFCASLEKLAYATTISISRGLIVISISLFVLTHFFGANGIWIATTVSEAICLVISIISLKNVLSTYLVAVPKQKVIATKVLATTREAINSTKVFAATSLVTTPVVANAKVCKTESVLKPNKKLNYAKIK